MKPLGTFFSQINLRFSRLTVFLYGLWVSRLLIFRVRKRCIWNMQKCSLLLLAKNAATWDEFSLFFFLSLRCSVHQSVRKMIALRVMRVWLWRPVLFKIVFNKIAPQVNFLPVHLLSWTRRVFLSSLHHDFFSLLLIIIIFHHVLLNH